ncbi:hypothetical protein CLF_108298 [Clonorchis sinensis]|uniref:Uncharacterized protein n=1 Tax=Clonorchis sinensis TaxID=79923 RepID=G7YRH6_CLOSI|nr:hypothetical protein CLF_108298 [Clonorchis sinensis]
MDAAVRRPSEWTGIWCQVCTVRALTPTSFHFWSITYILRDTQTDQKNTCNLTIASFYFCEFSWPTKKTAAHRIARPSPITTNMTSVTGLSRNQVPKSSGNVQQLNCRFLVIPADRPIRGKFRSITQILVGSGQVPTYGMMTRKFNGL